LTRLSSPYDPDRAELGKSAVPTRGELTSVSLAFATEVGGLNRENEDFVGATPDAVVVLDGAGYPARLRTGCVHTVAWYTRMLGSSLLAMLTACERTPRPATSHIPDHLRQPCSCSAGQRDPWTGWYWRTPSSSWT
jgi:hypothetical protein